MQNPFKFGSVVSGDDFADRRRELAELAREMSAGQHLFLLSRRRYGKTSLILRLLERLHSRRTLVAYVDVFRTTSAVQLLELIAQTVLRVAESRPERLLRLALDLLGRLRPQVGTDSIGQATLSFDVGAAPRGGLALQEEVLALPEIAFPAPPPRELPLRRLPTERAPGDGSQRSEPVLQIRPDHLPWPDPSGGVCAFSGGAFQTRSPRRIGGRFGGHPCGGGRRPV